MLKAVMITEWSSGMPEWDQRQGRGWHPASAFTSAQILMLPHVAFQPGMAPKKCRE